MTPEELFDEALRAAKKIKELMEKADCPTSYSQGYRDGIAYASKEFERRLDSIVASLQEVRR